MTEHSCHPPADKTDFLLWGSLTSIVILYTHFALFESTTQFTAWYATLSASVFDLVNTMWWGVTLGILMISALSRIPREFVMSILGSKGGLNGILRATAAGVLLDLCSHGILMVGAKLYERGASIGQIIAFLVASPWNSFSLTLILIALIGLWWTLAFIVLSMLIAIIAGLIFDALVSRGVLPGNPTDVDLPDDFAFWQEAREGLARTTFSAGFLVGMLKDGIKESRMVMRWILFGILLAGLVRAFLTPETFGTYFGPTLAGLGLTILVATIMEVCSEGSTPIAADLLTRANAPGNSFAFLMTGVSTDYTEIMVLRETTKSFKIALFLPLLTVPQVLIVAWMMNGMSV
jgi:uncharacterized protein